MNTNLITLKGKISAPLKSKMNELTPMALRLEVKRTSGVIDYIPILTDEILDTLKLYNFVEIVGQIRTRNEVVGGKRKLFVYVLAKEVTILENEEYENRVEIQAHICKPPTLRRTPLTNRTISDCLLANNSDIGISNYIPAIAFQSNAELLSKQKVGTGLDVEGRLQSRLYEKEIDGKTVEMTTYELCVNKMQIKEKKTNNGN